jgi:hypothetical protein
MRKNKVDQDLLLVLKEKLDRLNWCCELVTGGKARCPLLAQRGAVHRTCRFLG